MKASSRPIIINAGHKKEVWVDLRGNSAKSGRSIDKGGHTPAAGEKIKTFEKFEKFSRTRRIYLGEKIPWPQPHQSTDEKLGGCKESEVIYDKDNCCAAGMQQLNILPTKCKAFLFDMRIFTAISFLSNELGELATKYQAWHKQTANEKQSAGMTYAPYYS
jgi:hypothetical protein